MAKLSVVIPIYNKAKFLSKCLESILSQSFTELEVICVDDGSTDESLNIARQFASCDERIVIHSQPNTGVSSARNAGIRLVSSRFVTFIDPDDHLIDSSAYENMIGIAESDGSDIVFAYFYDCDENGRIVNDRFEGFCSSKAVSLRERARFIEFAYPWQKIYRRDLFEKIPTQFPHGIVFEDNPVNLRLLISANQISVYPNYIFKYIHHSEAITKQKNLDAFNMFTAVALMEQEIEQRRIIDREFVAKYIDYRLELLAWGYFSLPSSPRHKVRYLRQWEQLLTPRDRKRLKAYPIRKFDHVYKYIATGNTGLYILNQACGLLPRIISYPVRLAYSLIQLRKILDGMPR